MAEGEESTGASVWRSVLAASAGATAVFVLQKWFFQRDEAPILEALESLETRVARMEGVTRQPLAAAPPEDSTVYATISEYV